MKTVYFWPEIHQYEIISDYQTGYYYPLSKFAVLSQPSDPYEAVKKEAIDTFFSQINSLHFQNKCPMAGRIDLEIGLIKTELGEFYLTGRDFIDGEIKMGNQEMQEKNNPDYQPLPKAEWKSL